MTSRATGSGWFICWLATALIATACGGKTVVDGSGGSGSGGHSTASSSSSSGTTSTTSTPPCADATSCCQTLCPKLEALPCWPGGAECGCDANNMSSECAAAVLPVYQCLLDAWPNAYQCIDGLPLLVCGYCDTEIALYESKCGDHMTCHAP